MTTFRFDSRALATRACCLALSIAAVGCAAGEVQSKFSEKETCPSGSVSVVPARAPANVPGPEAPPPEIAADPARAALWRKAHDEDRRAHRFFLASGCGHADLYECDVPSDCIDGKGRQVSCNACDLYAALGSDGALAAQTPAVPVTLVFGQGPQAGKFGISSAGISTTVGGIRPGSPAAAAGLAVGDVVLEVDHQPVANGLQMMTRLYSGPSHVLRVNRGGSPIDLNITAP